MYESRPFYLSEFLPLIEKQIEWVEKNKELQKSSLSITRVGLPFSNERFLKEWSTISLCFGRRSGHSKLAMDLLKKYSDSYLTVVSGNHVNFLCKDIDISNDFLNYKDNKNLQPYMKMWENGMVSNEFMTIQNKKDTKRRICSLERMLNGLKDKKSNEKFSNLIKDKIVIIDGTFLMSKKDKKRIYEADPRFVIMLQ